MAFKIHNSTIFSIFLLSSAVNKAFALEKI